MIRQTVRLAVWLGGGAAVVGGLYWSFLNTPEANLLTLTFSAILVVLMMTVAALVVNVATLLALGSPVRSSVVAGARRSVAVVVVSVPVLALIWLINRGDAWVASRSGEISAWFIAKVGWADISPLFRTQMYLSIWLRWVLLPVTALAALAVWLRHGRHAIVTPRWVRAAWHWRTLLIATLAFVLLIAYPWRAAVWRPQGLPPTWIEPVLAAVRLAVVVVSMAIGAAVVIMTIARQTERMTSHDGK
jgi:hypothetical protein